MIGLNRRRVIAFGASITLGACALPPPPSSPGRRMPDPRIIVLIHGTWHGGWCWDWLVPLLDAQGFRVLAPDLTGLGARRDELSPDVGLQTHIDDVVALFEQHELRDVLLVGHSYGGMVISGAAQHLHDRLAGLVYLDAVVPQPGQSMATVGPPLLPEERAAMKTAIRALAPDGLYMPPLPPEAFGIPADHPRHDWVAERLSPHPLKSWLDPLPDMAPMPDLGRTFIHCIDPVLQPSSIPYYAARAKASPDWTYHEIPTGHDAMITAPGALSRLLTKSVTLT